LSENLGVTLPYDELFELRNRLCELAPYLVKYDYTEKHGFEDLLVDLYRNDDLAINNTNLVECVDNFYMTNNISRASPTMAKCSHQLNKKRFKTFSDSLI
jgi:NADH dehydrogenase (ubiquinone) Fe-S protein 1